MSRAELWSDDPAELDLLSFDAVASTAADALMDPVLDPVALALSGSWGSGKTTVLRLTSQELADRADDGKKVLVIETDPWRYDPSVGIKESLIAEILGALAREIEKSSPADSDAKSKALGLVTRLAKRVDWTKAIKLAAKTSLALQIPSVDEVVSLIKEPSQDDEEEESRTLDQFREDFGEVIESPALAHVQLVAVLVDDLDRCLPETVIETLETIRLFLAVDRMSFVIAADEERVADAIANRLGSQVDPAAGDAGEGETPAQLYLHKIVQTTIPIPSLSRFDTQAFLLQLLLERGLDRDKRRDLATACADLRRSGQSLDSLEIDGISIDDELAIASRLTPLLYEKHHGNPRRLKRFLNDLRVRQSIAARRGIDLDVAVVAKLMVLETLLPDEFATLMRWLGSGTLRDRLGALETEAGKPPEVETTTKDGDEEGEEAPTADETKFPEQLVRWAKLPPALSPIDLSPYLFLAASFRGATVLDEALPGRLRDIAANLISSSRVDQRAVEDGDIAALRDTEPADLIKYLGRAIRDQPSRQQGGVTGILRLVRAHPSEAPTAKAALLMLPADQVSIGTPLLVLPDDPKEIFEALEAWKNGATPEVEKAISKAVEERS